MDDILNDVKNKIFLVLVDVSTDSLVHLGLLLFMIRFDLLFFDLLYSFLSLLLGDLSCILVSTNDVDNAILVNVVIF